MHVETLVLGPLQTNCYVVWDNQSRQAIFIDPADSGDVISQLIVEHSLDLQTIVLTHGHFDHVLGLLELKLNFPATPIVMHRADLFLLERAQQSAHHWLGFDVDPVPPPDTYIQEGGTLSIGTEQLTILETPGHTPGSICLYDNNVAFTGDTLFLDGVGSTEHRYSSQQQLQQSIKKISTSLKNRQLYSGHGESWFL